MHYRLFLIFLLLLTLGACSYQAPSPGSDCDEGYFSGTLISFSDDQAVIYLDSKDPTLAPELLESCSEIQFSPDSWSDSPLTPKVGDKVSGTYSTSRPFKQVANSRVELEPYNWGLTRHNLTATVLEINDQWVIVEPAEEDPLRENFEKIWISLSKLQACTGKENLSISIGDLLSVLYIRDPSLSSFPQVEVIDWGIET